MNELKKEILIRIHINTMENSTCADLSVVKKLTKISNDDFIENQMMNNLLKSLNKDFTVEKLKNLKHDLKSLKHDLKSSKHDLKSLKHDLKKRAA